VGRFWENIEVMQKNHNACSVSPRHHLLDPDNPKKSRCSGSG
jgi:hypothetical protein